MALQRRTKRWRPAAPEFIGVFLCVVLLFAGVLAWRATTAPPWPHTTGTVLSCNLRSVHYNAEPNDTKVSLSYEYVVGGQTYAARWEGLWPVAGSPNALPEERLHELETPGYRLRVYYDPENPSRSELEDGSRDNVLLFSLFFVGSLATFLVYVLKIYPTWRLSRAL